MSSGIVNEIMFMRRNFMKKHNEEPTVLILDHDTWDTLRKHLDLGIETMDGKCLGMIVALVRSSSFLKVA